MLTLPIVNGCILRNGHFMEQTVERITTDTILMFSIVHIYKPYYTWKTQTKYQQIEIMYNNFIDLYESQIDFVFESFLNIRKFLMIYNPSTIPKNVEK